MIHFAIMDELEEGGELSLLLAFTYNCSSMWLATLAGKDHFLPRLWTGK